MSAYWTKKELETTIAECTKKLNVIKKFLELDKSQDFLDKENLTKNNLIFIRIFDTNMIYPPKHM